MLNGAEILAATPDSTDDSRLSVDIKESHHQKELRMVSTKQETETNFSVNGENHCSVGPQSVVELITINDDSFDATSNKKKSSDSLNETSTNQTVLPPLPDGDISQEDKRLQLGLLVKEIKEQSQASMMVQSRLCDSFANFTQLLGNLESTLSAMPVLVNQLIQQSQQQPYQQHQAANSIVLMPPSSQVVQPHYQQGFCSQFMLR